jgi:hypothetical protein
MEEWAVSLEAADVFARYELSKGTGHEKAQHYRVLDRRTDDTSALDLGTEGPNDMDKVGQLGQGTPPRGECTTQKRSLPWYKPRTGAL